MISRYSNKNRGRQKCPRRYTKGIHVNIQLIIAGHAEQSQATEHVWRTICEDMGLLLQVANSESEGGRSLVEKLALRTLPALVVNGRVIAVGQPDKTTAEKILHDLQGKTD